MRKSENEKALTWMKTWKAAQAVLEEDRRTSIVNADTEVFVNAMAGMVDMAIKKLPPRKYSGLVEQQSYFMRARS